MNAIKITEDRREMVSIGKAIFQEKKMNYPPQMCKVIMTSIDSCMKDDGNEAKQNMFYQSIYDYWAYGASISEEFYMNFRNLSHAERLEYIPFRWRLIHTWDMNDRKDEHLFSNKYETYQLLRDHYLREVIEVKSESDFDKFQSFAERHNVFVVKPLSLSYGIGVYKVDIADYTDLHQCFTEILSNGKENVENVTWSNDSAIVLEEVIDQVKELADIHPYSCNGIRITTLRVGNEVHIVYPWFKVGANKGFVTSAAFGTYDAGIDPDTGIVNTHGYKEDGSWDEIHPLTKIPFKGYEIPCWKDLVELVKKLSFAVPEIRYTGWDMVLTPKGWCVMEANFSGEYMWQMFRQEGFRKEFEELTGLRRTKEFWWQ